MKNYLRILTALVVLVPAAAFASSKVSSPDVTGGQTEFEYRFGYDNDDRASRDEVQNHRFVANHGITDRWRVEVKANMAGDSDDLDWTFAELSNRYQIFKGGEAWARFAVQQNFKFALTDGVSDRFELSALAAKDVGKFGYNVNVNFENEFGENAVGGTAMNIGWKAKYRYKPELEPNLELYTDFGKLSRSSPDRVFFGPAISGKVMGVKYDTGYLVGMNDDTTDGRFKLILTYAF